MILGIKTNMKSTNWFAKVGCEDKHVIIAGCQIHYAVKTDEQPNIQDVTERMSSSEEKKNRDTHIYIAEILK